MHVIYRIIALFTSALIQFCVRYEIGMIYKKDLNAQYIFFLLKNVSDCRLAILFNILIISSMIEINLDSLDSLLTLTVIFVFNVENVKRVSISHQNKQQF